MRYIPEIRDQLPTTCGVYTFYDRNNTILYVGKAKNLKNRILSYFSSSQLSDEKTRQLVSLIAYIEITETISEFDSLLLEAKCIKRLQPKYNVLWKDDKHYLYIKITKEPYPRILLSRRENDRNALYFGPFPTSSIIKKMISYIRTIFPFCTQKSTVKKPCFYTHINLCNPCPASIRKLDGIEYRKAKAIYRSNIRQIIRLLHGKYSFVLKNLSKSMNEFSKKQEFEKAAYLRDTIGKLSYLTHRFTSSEMYMENPYLVADEHQKEQHELHAIVKKYFDDTKKPKKIECYDISNISGQLAVGSMIVFIDAQPEKKLYRRFKIRTVSNMNDFGMIAEVIKRRLLHKEWILPDLIVIDGGKPQLNAVKDIFSINNCKIPTIGLAKEYEEIIIPNKNKYEKIKLPDNSPALHLMQRLRDEAHRFAHAYHVLLRLKHIVSSVEK